MTIKNYFSLAATACLAVTATPFSKADDIKIEPAGLQIVWNDHGKAFGGFKVLNEDKGVKVVLVAESPGKKIIAFDDDESKLVISDGTTQFATKIGSFEKISKDGKFLKLEATTKKVPGAEAKVLHVTGQVEITTASAVETGKAGPQQYKEGDAIELADDFKFTIKKIGKPKWGDDPLEISLHWKQRIEQLAEIRFYDEAGKIIKSEKGGWSRGGFGKNWSETRSYRLKRKADIFKIEVDLWTDAKKVTVPVDFKIGMNGKVK